MVLEDNEASTRSWWEQRRLAYNICLIAAGLLAFACYAAVGWTRCTANLDFEITAFTTFFQALGYLAAIAIANVSYFLGPISEHLIQPSNPSHYRRTVFAIGVIFSVALPFLIPTALYLTC